ncbi:hypothetical protein EC396_08860 [Lutibacter sp. HS1-25]|uniref:heavy metal-binding domain-containing protein n=1 Tax=Lutibacter sp. HS1-25 TaxID=2485000 RepID=UPI001010DB0E|nr:heavy metal-binding domain-containing protein [Lutibacter sp. HS1-25]RXP54814.1 hypothetical protein EC396_08860 [Lutibacter sp. HS1-25]
MNTKKVLAVLVIAIVGLSTMNAQEMDHSKMKKDSTKMEMDHSKMEMKMDHSKMNQDSSTMDMDHSKMQKEKVTKVYTCSMHPEVISDKPGECPKCGMNLVEKKMEMKKMDDKKEDGHKHKH